MTNEEVIAFVRKNPVSIGCGVLSLVLAGLSYWRSGQVPDSEAELMQKSAEGERYAANLKNANFSEANLDGADLSGAKLAGAVFHSAIMTGIPLSKLNFERGQLEGCVLDPTPAAMAMAERKRTGCWQKAGRWHPLATSLRPFRGA